MLARMVLASLLFSASAVAGITSLDLTHYQLSATIPLPAGVASEASAIAYNRDSGNLFVIGDEGEAIVEVTPQGVPVSTMFLTGFDDTEGMTYVGNGQFVIAEERIQDVFRITYSSGATVDRSSLQHASLGDTVGNVGIEGVSFEPLTGMYFAVKEKTPEAVLSASVDFPGGAATVSSLFDPASLGLSDLSDVQVLSVVPTLVGTPDQDNLLILSQESQRLLEVSRTGQILSQFDLSGIATNIEGVTIGADGTIYLCDETPNMHILSPVPAPGAAVILAAGALATRRRRRSC